MSHLILVAAFRLAAALPFTPDDLAAFEKLEPYAQLEHLRLEVATLQDVMRTYGDVPKDQWLKQNGKPYPYICYAAPDGSRIGISFDVARGDDPQTAHKIEIVGPGGTFLYRATYRIDAKDEPRCRDVKKLPTGVGRLRLGMTKADVTAVLGAKKAWRGAGFEFFGFSADADAHPGDYWEVGGSKPAQFTPAEREKMVRLGLDPGDYYTAIELQLIFKDDRLIVIRVARGTQS